MQEFKINDYITLKLENNETNIYINNKLFRQCKFLLLNIPIKKLEGFDGISSIDEAEEQLDGSMEVNKIELKIPAQTEFWAHCSNMQVWYENNYNTRLLHSNLSFPLLKKLTEVGDPLAKRAFKEEIAKRLASGYQPIIDYLMEEQYIQYLSSEELFYAVLIPEEAEALLMIERHLTVENKENLWLVEELEHELAPCFTIKNNHVSGLDLFECGLKSIPRDIDRLKSLEMLSVRNNKLNNLPEFLNKMPSLKVLHVGGNKKIKN